MRLPFHFVSRFVLFLDLLAPHVKCEVIHNMDMGMGHLWLIMGGTFMAYNGWCIYGLMGGNL